MTSPIIVIILSAAWFAAGYFTALRIKRQQLSCFHHTKRPYPDTSYESYIEGQIIDLGRRKSFTCLKCNGMWLT